jgi:hypothetical protein
MDEKQAKPFLEWLRIRAAQLIDNYWRQVEDVAAAVLEQQKLSGKELRQVIQQSLGLLFADILPTAVRGRAAKLVREGVDSLMSVGGGSAFAEAAPNSQFCSPGSAFLARGE